MATSGNFGTVQTADNNEVLSWQWEESADNTNWQNVGTILTDISGQNTQTLTVNSANISMNNTFVRCKANYSGGSTFSDPTLLTVTAPAAQGDQTHACVD